MTLNLSNFYNVNIYEIIENYQYHEYDYYPCGNFFTMLDFMAKYYLPFIVSFGLFGNVLSCIVFLNTHLKLRSSSYYLAALAVADFGFLVTVLIVHLTNNGVVDLYRKEYWCQSLVYKSSVCSFLSVWLIVAFTVERFVAVTYPLHRPTICTISRAKSVIFFLTLTALLVNSYCFFTAGPVADIYSDEVECNLKPEYYEMMKIINIVDTLVTLILPLIIIIVLNIMITKNLWKFGKYFKNRRESASNHINLQASISNTTDNNSFLPPPRPPRQNSSQQFEHLQYISRSMTSIRNQNSITKMLLLTSTVFIFLNIPSYVIRMYVFIFHSLMGKETSQLLWCVQQFFMYLYYTNFSINFILYSMCGATFRRCLRQLISNKIKNCARYKINQQKYG